MDQKVLIEEITAATAEVVAESVHSIQSGLIEKFEDIGIYNEKQEHKRREWLKTWVAYAEDGPSFDPAGKYLCGTCSVRLDPDECAPMKGKVSMESGSCRMYTHGLVQIATEPYEHQLDYAEAQYGERPEAKGFGCSRCEYASEAKKPDSQGRKTWCNYFGLHVRKLACCAVEAGDDSTVPKQVKAAQEVSLAGEQKGTLWNGIKITGFTGPEEEGLRAMLSRIPPELLTNVKEIKSANELNAKHGKYDPATNTISFNPDNFSLRQKLGQGESWIRHPELTVVHEVGHSIYHSFTPEQVQKWNDLSGWMVGWKPGQSMPYEEKRPGWGNAKSEYSHKAGIKFTRHYAERNPNEDFADCFAFYILNHQHQMQSSKKKFIHDYIEDHVHSYPQVSIESPENKKLQNLYNKNTTNIHGSGTTEGAEKAWDTRGRGRHKLDDKSQKALASYVPQTKEKFRQALLSELLVKNAIGGHDPAKTYGMTWHPFDVMKGNKIAIEVKTLFPGSKQTSLTMHPDSLQRKKSMIKKLGIKKVYTVAVDTRTSLPTIYVREGVGSFALSSMKQVSSFKGLKKEIR